MVLGAKVVSLYVDQELIITARQRGINPFQEQKYTERGSSGELSI